MATVNECKALARLVEEKDFKRVNRSNGNIDYFKTMVIFIYGTMNGIHDVETIYRDTKCSLYRIKRAVANLTENGIWKDGVAYVDFDEGQELFEIVLCTLCAMGQVRRFQEIESYPVPAFPLKLIPALADLERKLLNETLEQIELNRLYRENRPYEFQIPKDILYE